MVKKLTLKKFRQDIMDECKRALSPEGFKKISESWEMEQIIIDGYKKYEEHYHKYMEKKQ